MQSSFGGKWHLNNVSGLTVRAMFPTKKEGCFLFFSFLFFFVLFFTFTYFYLLKTQEDATTGECFKEMCENN